MEFYPLLSRAPDKAQCASHGPMPAFPLSKFPDRGQPNKQDIPVLPEELNGTDCAAEMLQGHAHATLSPEDQQKRLFRPRQEVVAPFQKQSRHPWTILPNDKGRMAEHFVSIADKTLPFPES